MIHSSISSTDSIIKNQKTVGGTPNLLHTWRRSLKLQEFILDEPNNNYGQVRTCFKHQLLNWKFFGPNFELQKGTFWGVRTRRCSNHRAIHRKDFVHRISTFVSSLLGPHIWSRNSTWYHMSNMHGHCIERLWFDSWIGSTFLILYII